MAGKMALLSSSQFKLLQAARPLAHPSVPANASTCAHPTRPAPLRRLCEFSEPCVELLVASTSAGRPCCILPTAPVGIAQTRGLFSLVNLEGLSAATVIDRLASVEGHVANTCTTCPTRECPQDVQQPAQPSSLVYSPEFNCFLERCLELAQLHKDLGPAPAVLLLQIVSRLNFAADPSLRESFSRYYLHLQVELQSAVELHRSAITPQVALAMFEAWARMGAPPTHSKTFGLALRSHIQTGRFTPQELSRLLAAMAAIRGARPSYRPSQYDVADVCGKLRGSALRKLAASHLESVASSLGAFPWPVYQCVVPLLEAVAQEAVRRQTAGQLSPAAASKLVATAVDSMSTLNARLGSQLEAQAEGWKAQARLQPRAAKQNAKQNNNVLGFAHGHPAEEAAACL